VAAPPVEVGGGAGLRPGGPAAGGGGGRCCGCARMMTERTEELLSHERQQRKRGTGGARFAHAPREKQIPATRFAYPPLLLSATRLLFSLLACLLLLLIQGKWGKDERASSAAVQCQAREGSPLTTTSKIALIALRTEIRMAGRPPVMVTPLFVSDVPGTFVS
jgi:hypothetical protein